MNYLYLLINFGAVVVPFLFSFHPKILFYKEWKKIVGSIGLPFLFFIVWDNIFTAKGVWGFNPDYILGFHILNLPIEEILFFICIPYACLFTWYCLKKVWDDRKMINNQHWVHYFISVLFILIAVFFRTQAYTFYTFLFLGVFFLILIYFFNSSLFLFYKVFAVLLLPFFIVNGILTGTGIDEEVVWYNNNENWSIRLLTIPLEDVFYGMLLISMNVFFFEKFSTVKKS